MKDWESICSNCGKCCYMHDYDAVNKKAINATKCPYRDDEKKICTCYENRSKVQPKCGQLTEDMIPFLHKIGVLPDSCEYVKNFCKGETK